MGLRDDHGADPFRFRSEAMARGYPTADIFKPAPKQRLRTASITEACVASGAFLDPVIARLRDGNWEPTNLWWRGGEE